MLSARSQQLVSFSLVILLLLAIGIFYLFSFKNQDIRSRASITGPTLSLIPASKTIRAGEEFSLGVILNTNTASVSATEIDLSFDPSVLQIIGFTPSTPLPVVLAAERTGDGTATVTLGSSPTTPFNGTAVIGTFNIRILTPNNSTITFTSETKVASIGKTVNVLVSTTGTTLSL